MSKHLIHKRSSVVINNQPKLPTSNSLEVGEIAINFADGYETISILNSSSGIATFSSDSIIESKIPSEQTISSSGFTKNGLPNVTAADNGKILSVINGQWSATTPLMVYSGNGTPSDVLGNNGDIFLQTS